MSDAGERPDAILSAAVKAVTIKPREIIPPGRVYVMPNIDHPEIDLRMTIDEADHLIIACHPSHEQAVRDAVALEQERPKWWRDMRAIEAAIGGNHGG